MQKLTLLIIFKNHVNSLLQGFCTDYTRCLGYYVSISVDKICGRN